jgi:hypothetical protein
MQNATPRQLIGRLQSLLNERKHNSETPLQAFLDYLKAEREVLEILLLIPQDQFESAGRQITEETPQDAKLATSSDRPYVHE